VHSQFFAAESDDSKPQIQPAKQRKASPSVGSGAKWSPRKGLGMSLSSGLWEPRHHICILPLANTSCDLNSIQPNILADLLRGKSKYRSNYDEVKYNNKVFR